MLSQGDPFAAAHARAQAAFVQDAAAGITTAAEDPSALAHGLIADMEADGLLAAGTASVAPEQKGNFDGLATELKEIVHGQDGFVDALVRAMRRPVLLGTQPPKPRNVVLITGGEGTGRHFALAPLLSKMAARGLLQNDGTHTLDLSLYADGGNEKIFLQDLFAALQSKGDVLIFEGYEHCHPSFLKTIAALAATGRAPLSSRYLLNKDGILIDAGTALSPDAIGTLEAGGKYFLFYSHKGKTALADKFGAGFIACIGDVCATEAFTPDALHTIAGVHLEALRVRVQAQLGFALCADDSVQTFLAHSAHKTSGAKGIVDACTLILRALSEYCLAQDTMPREAVTLAMQPISITAHAAQEGAQDSDALPTQTSDTTLTFAFGESAPAPLFDLLPPMYKGSREATEAQLDALVGLDSVKDYVRALADNVQVQQRRRDAGLKTASLSMHMIYSGNPGTGKTTIARLVAAYLKAIGALSGGQLIEVSRGDLVGRYSGHTAPLTNNVIESALGGVLFIDEAYSLYRGEQDSFGLEAIDTLVKGMEDNRDNLVVILAGYTNEMNVFLTANSGLASRFSNNIEFPDYTGAELLAITKLQARGKGYTIDDACELPLLAFYNAQQAAHADTAGNGRLARNTLEKAILNQSRRLVAVPDAALDVLCAEDFALDEGV